MRDVNRAKIEAIISLLDYGEVRPQYQRCEVIPGLIGPAGYEFGYCGFRTDGAGAAVVDEVVARCSIARALLEPYLPRLRQLAITKEESIAGLDGFAGVWERVGNLPDVVEAQEVVADQLYYYPALAERNRLGCLTPLALACLYDATRRRNGEFGIGAMLKSVELGYEPGVISEFLDTWEATCDCRAHHSAARGGRMEAWRSLVAEGNWDLNLPIRVRSTEVSYDIRAEDLGKS